MIFGKFLAGFYEKNSHENNSRKCRNNWMSWMNTRQVYTWPVNLNSLVQFTHTGVNSIASHNERFQNWVALVYVKKIHLQILWYTSWSSSQKNIHRNGGAASSAAQLHIIRRREDYWWWHLSRMQSEPHLITARTWQLASLTKYQYCTSCLTTRSSCNK